MASNGMHTKVEVRNNTQTVLSSIDNALSKGLEAVGMKAETYAKKNCAVDTGRLRNSITHEVRNDEDAVYIGSRVEYAPYVEFGTSRQRAQPFLRPAATEHGAEYRRIIEAALKASE